MINLGKSTVCVVGCALLVGACGPAPEGEELEAAEPKSPELVEPGTPEPEAAEPGTVSQQSMVGDLGRRVGSPVATYPTTCTASNQWRTTCGSGASRDISYVWRVPETGSYRFSTYGSSFDTLLEIRNYRSTNEVMGCNDDAGSGYQSAITLSGLVKGVVLLITIEGYDGECGAAQLNITKR